MLEKEDQKEFNKSAKAFTFGPEQNITSSKGPALSWPP